MTDRLSDQTKAADRLQDKINHEFRETIQRLSEDGTKDEPRPINISLGQFFTIMLTGFALGFATAVFLVQVCK